MFAAIYSRFALVLNASSGAFACRFGAGVSAGCSAAAADAAADAGGVAALSFDLDRAGGSAGAVGGVAEELRPRAGLLGAGATTTASEGSAAAPDELDAAPLVREALLLLALAAGSC